MHQTRQKGDGFGVQPGGNSTPGLNKCCRFCYNVHGCSRVLCEKLGSWLQVLRFETGVFGNLLQHDRADFDVVMERPGKIREAGPHELTM